MINYPLIEALKIHGSNFNKNHLMLLQSDSHYGNLILVWSEIVVRIDCVNDQIIQLYDKFYESEKIVKLQGYFEQSLNDSYRNSIMLTEQIIYWLRKTADEIISLISVLSHFKEKKSYPKKIKTSSIFEFLNSDNLNYMVIENYKTFLKTLNEISNCYKHSFLNSQITAYRGAIYPVAFAYNLHYNDLKNEPKFISINLSNFLSDYNSFLKDVKLHIEFELKE